MKDVDEKALKVLLRYFARRKYSEQTVGRWTGLAVEFIVFLEKHDRTINDVGDKLNSEGRVVMQEEFGAKDFLDTKTKYEARYLYYLHQVLKRFYTAWEKHFPIPNEEFPKVMKEPKRIMLSPEQSLKVAGTAKRLWLKQVEKYPDELTGLRDYTMVLIGIDCGARRYQINKLNCGHYNTEKGTLFIPAAKGGRDTLRVLSKVVNDVMMFYIQKRRQVDTANNAMFLSTTGKRIALGKMSERLSHICKKAGIYERGMGYHSLRRGKTRRLKEGGFTEEQINDTMGWRKGSKMSHIYGELDQQEVQRKATEIDTIFKGKDDKEG